MPYEAKLVLENDDEAKKPHMMVIISAWKIYSRSAKIGYEDKVDCETKLWVVLNEWKDSRKPLKVLGM